MSAAGDRLYSVFVRWPWSVMWVAAIVTAILICKIVGLP
jgi:hypothetical protein